MKYGADPLYPALNSAMDACDYRAVQILIEYGADINSRQPGAIWEIQNKQHSRKIGYGMTVLEKSLEMDDTALLEYFLSKKSDPLAYRIFKEESQYNYPISTTFYLINTYTTTAMYEAIRLGRLDCIILFKQHGSDLDAICYKKVPRYDKQTVLTPIQAAIQFHQVDIVSYLLSQDVKI